MEELLGRMSSLELSEWMAYATLEPFGEERADLRAGIVASVIANTARKPNTKPFQPYDFMPFLERDEVERIRQDTVSEKIRHAFSQFSRKG